MMTEVLRAMVLAARVRERLEAAHLLGPLRPWEEQAPAQ